MRPPQETPPHASFTPIFDALYSEYRRSFRALPGDRSGEEDLGYTGFGTTTGQHHQHGHGGHLGPVHTAPYSPWQSLHTQHAQGRQYTGNHVPAALPPAPRRGY
ncbi:hypothetical protein [Streptomyces sp. NPDC058657]|uniref:hypothetical protein n=1 Tax=unclassified Streptomyces TaxID=2593676 RepID=UPI00364CF94C